MLYIDEPATMLTPFMVASRWKRWGALYPRLRQVEKTLWTLTPPLMLPFGNKRPFMNRVNQSVLASYIRWAMKKLEFAEDHIFWTYLPGHRGSARPTLRRPVGRGPCPHDLPLRGRALSLPGTLHVARDCEGLR